MIPGVILDIDHKYFEMEAMENGLIQEENDDVSASESTGTLKQGDTEGFT